MTSPIIPTVSALVLAFHAAQAQEASRNRMSISYRAGFLVDADFKNHGSAPTPGGPSLAGSYSDGFVRTDNTGNAGGLTTHWGYDSPSQVSGGNVYLRGSRDGSIGENAGSDFSHGFEFLYGRYLGTLGKGRWGLDFGLNYMSVKIDAGFDASRSVLNVDGFGLGGIVPPGAPYAGPFTSGPGVPLLPSAGMPTVVSVQNQLDSTLYGFKAGPFWELPLFERVTLGVGAGFTLLVADTDYSFGESYGGIRRSGSVGRTDLLPGGYGSVSLSFSLTQRMSFDAGFQLQGAESMRLRTQDKEARLDLGLHFLWTSGLRWEF